GMGLPLLKLRVSALVPPPALTWIWLTELTGSSFRRVEPWDTCKVLGSPGLSWRVELSPRAEPDRSMTPPEVTVTVGLTWISQTPRPWVPTATMGPVSL